MIIIKTSEEIAKLRTAGPILARIVREVAGSARAGMTTGELDKVAEAKMREAGGTPGLLGYRPEGARKPYPATMCISVNNEVVHGIPGTKVLKDGDIVSFDTVLKYDGVFVDYTLTVAIGGKDKLKNKRERELLEATEASLYEGIYAIKPGSRTGDIGAAVEAYAKAHKLGIVRGLSGHGVGRHIHEDPYVPNYGKKGKGELLQPGMVIAIEPMLTLGAEDVLELRDGYTLVTSDRSKAAHFEHTVLINEAGEAEILTQE